VISKTREYLLQIMLLNNRTVNTKTTSPPELVALDIENMVQNLRNVTFRLQNEFKNYEGFEQWYNKKQEIMKNDEDMVLFNDLRIKIVHQKKTAKSTTTLSTNIPYTVNTKKGEFVPVSPPLKFLGDGKFEIVDDGSFDLSNFKLEESYSFEERPNDDPILLCSKHFLKLSNLVDECETKFLKED
jgi:hypothetical protein